MYIFVYIYILLKGERDRKCAQERERDLYIEGHVCEREGH